MFLNTIFLWFFSILASENGAKIHAFLLLFKKPSILWKCSKTLAVRTKIKVQTQKNHEKNHQKIDSQTYSEKTLQKTSQNSILTSILASQNPQNASKIEKKPSRSPLENELKKQASANHRPGPDHTASQAFWGPAGPSNYPSND